MSAVSNFEYNIPFAKAAHDLVAGTFVCLDGNGNVNNPGSLPANLTRILGVCNSNTKRDLTVPVTSFPGQRATVIVRMGANQSLSAGDTVKTNSDGYAVKAGNSDDQFLHLGVVVGPEYKTGSASGDGATVAANDKVYTSIILR